MSEFLQYWWHCVQIGWELGDGVFEKIEGVTIIISAGFLCHRKLFKHRDTLEENAMKWAFHIFWISFVASTVFVAPFIQHDKAEGLSKTVSDLIATTNNLQRNLDKDESALKAISAITGITNGTLTENLVKIPVRLDEMQRDLKTAQGKLFAVKTQELFRLSDTNSVAFFISHNHGPRAFFKLKHIPVKDTVEGIVQGPMGQMPIVGISEDENILWISFPESRGLDEITFLFTYSLSGNDTDLIKNVWTNNGDVFFDNHRQVFFEPPEN